MRARLRRARGGDRASIRALLSDRNFLPYLVGNMLSTTGTWFQTLAQAIVVYGLTHSVFMLGVLGFAQYAAVYVLPPVVGRVADRYDRRRILVASQLAATAITATLCVLTAAHLVTAPIVIVFAFLLGATTAFSTPMQMALVPSLVGTASLSTALALNSVTFNVGRAIGPVLAAVVIKEAGAAWAFGINSVSYLALVAGVLAVHPRVTQVAPSKPPRIGQSIRLVLRERWLAALLFTIAAMNLATDPPITLGPAFMSREFHHPPSLAGLLVGAFGVGAILAAFTVAHRLTGTRNVITATLMLEAAGVVVFALAPNLPLALVGLVVLGFGYLSSNTAATTRLQLSVEPTHRGRIMVLWSLAFLGARPLGAIVDGAVASWAGLRVAAITMALPALLGAGVFFAAGLRARAGRGQPRERLEPDEG